MFFTIMRIRNDANLNMYLLNGNYNLVLLFFEKRKVYFLIIVINIFFHYIFPYIYQKLSLSETINVFHGCYEMYLFSFVYLYLLIDFDKGECLFIHQTIVFVIKTDLRLS